MNAAGFGDIVRRLLLREVGNMARHGGGEDEASSATLLEVVANSLGTVEAASEIGVDDLVPIFDGTIKDPAIGCAAGVGDECIDLKAKKSVASPLVSAKSGRTLPKSLMTSATKASALAYELMSSL